MEISILHFFSIFKKNLYTLPFLTLLVVFSSFIFLIFLFLFFKNIKLILAQFSNISKKTKIILLLIITLFSIFLFVIPHGFTMYIDEMSYLYNAYNINKLDFIQVNNIISPIGTSLLLSPIFFFTEDRFVFLFTSTIFGILTLFLIFAITYKISKNERTAIFSVIIYSFFIEYIFVNVSLQKESFSYFFFLLSVLFLILYYEKNNEIFFNLYFISLALASLFRSIDYFLILFFIISLFFLNKVIKFDKKKIVYLILISILLIPNLLFSSVYVFGDNWAERSSLGEFKHNFSIENLIYNTLNYGYKIFFLSGLNIFFSIILLIFILLGFYKIFLIKKDYFYYFLILIFMYYLGYFSAWPTLHLKERFYLFFYLIFSIVLGISTTFLKKKDYIVFFIIILILIPHSIYSFSNNSHEFKRKYIQTKAINDLIKSDTSCIVVTYLKESLAPSDIKKITVDNFINLYENNKDLLNNDCYIIFYDGYTYDYINSNGDVLNFYNSINKTIIKNYSNYVKLLKLVN